jgi:hypothetical protein
MFRLMGFYKVCVIGLGKAYGLTKLDGNTMRTFLELGKNTLGTLKFRNIKTSSKLTLELFPRKS